MLKRLSHSRFMREMEGFNAGSVRITFMRIAVLYDFLWLHAMPVTHTDFRGRSVLLKVNQCYVLPWLFQLSLLQWKLPLCRQESTQLSFWQTDPLHS